MAESPYRLPDREQLTASLNAHLAENGNRHLALLVIRVLRQDKINREYGFEALNRVHGEVVHRLKQVCRSGDTLGRMSGADFGLVLPGLMGVGQAILAAQKFIKICGKNLNLDGHKFKINIAVGIAMFPDHAADARELIRCADQAVTEAESAVDGFEVFSGWDEATVQRSLTMEGELDQAIRNGEIQMHYQPKIDLGTGRYSGMESLARWNSPTVGLVRSDTFIDLAEKTGLIQPLTMLTLNIGLREYNEIRQRAPNSNIAVNLSAAILHEQELLDLVLRALDVWNVEPESLTLEVTETAVMADTARSLRTLERLSTQGIRISMDDFGTGQSSLRYLKSLPLSELKIDKSFIMNMMNNEDDIKITGAIINLAHTFDLRVVAEGIEDAATLARLTELGCEYGQGFHIGKPMILGDLLAWLDAHAGGSG